MVRQVFPSFFYWNLISLEFLEFLSSSESADGLETQNFL